MKQTRTINQLHFEDLDPIRFEELILSMVYRQNRWYTINHFGKKGSDDGIDIEATEMLENGKIRKYHYHYQCKRYNKISKSQLKKIVDDYLKKNTLIPEKYFLILACPLTKANIDYFRIYAESCGFKSVDIWTNSVIEAMIYSDYHDLLFAYFGIRWCIKK